MMGKIEEILAQLPEDVDAITRGIGWDNKMLSPGITLVKAREEARRHVFDNEYAERLWLAIIYLAALCENKDYRPHKSGLFNCQSAVFYLDTVMVNFAEMIEATKNTADKLTKDGDATRAERLKGLSEILDNLKINITNIREYINSGKSGL